MAHLLTKKSLWYECSRTNHYYNNISSNMSNYEKKKICKKNNKYKIIQQ